MTIAEKQAQLVAQLSYSKNSQERFAYVVRRGRDRGILQPEFKTDASRIEGCLAKVWFVAEFKEGKCHFKTDSDSAIVKGISVILCDFYSGQTPEEILGAEPSFLEKVGIDQHLTPNRRNSLSKVWRKIQIFAEKNKAADGR